MTGHPILDYLGEHVWAMRRSTLDHLTGLVMRHARGIKIDAAEIEAIKTRRADGGAQTPRLPKGFELRGNIAVIPIRGVIAKYAAQVNGSSQPRGTSAEAIVRGLRGALEDESVEGILLNIHSPGGTVSGVPGLAEEILSSRSEKPIWAHAEDLMASAAYWIGSQAGRIYASKAADVGSIGVFAAVVDESRAAENEGFRVHVVKAGEFKGTGIAGTPIEKADLEHIQKHVNQTRDLFVEAIAEGREGLDVDDVRELATGDTWLATEALELGLIDGVLSFEETLAALQEHVGGEPGDFDARGQVELRGDGSSEGEMTLKNQGQEPQDEQPKAGKAEKADAPSLEGATLEQLQAANPQLVEQLQKSGAESERARIAEIRESALAGQDELAEQLIKDGASPDEARRKFLEDLKAGNAKGAAQLLADAPETVGEDPEPDPQLSGYREPSTDSLASLSDEELSAQAKSDWEKHQAQLQEEGFLTRDAYEGHLTAERAKALGRVL